LLTWSHIVAESLKGVIRADECYTLEAFKERLGIQDAAWWRLRDDGLKPVKVGNKLVIVGKQAIAHFERMSQCQESSSLSSMDAST
jgi:hypothetical protein